MDYSKFESLYLNAQKILSLRIFRKSHIKKGNVFNWDETATYYENYLAAATYLLEGVFSYVGRDNDVFIFPKQKGKTYPHRFWLKHQYATAHLEGLCRTLLIAAPLIKQNSDYKIKGIGLAEFYRGQLTQLVNSDFKYRIEARLEQQNEPNQRLVELGSLAISLSICPEMLWDPLSIYTKEKLYEIMISYGLGPTVPNNWRFFNIFIISFFKVRGYKTDEELLHTLLNGVLADYRGDGWYNDNPAFDYYSMWGFQTYSIIWTQLYGDLVSPNVVSKLKNNFRELGEIYPYIFSRDGKMIMWGRSATYRTAAIAPFLFAGLFPEDFNLGWLKKITKNVLHQFLGNSKLIDEKIPTLGFYGAFEPVVQPYNCRSSVFWMGKAFLGLMLQDKNEFWNASSNNGPWENYELNKVYNYFGNRSSILVSNYPRLGASEIRVSVEHTANKSNNPYLMDENYNKLSYNSEFPWQADCKDGTVSMNYAWKEGNNDWQFGREYSFSKYENNFYERTLKLDQTSSSNIILREKTIPNGIIRMDEIQANRKLNLNFGHYALPELDKSIEIRKVILENLEITIIDNGIYKLGVGILKGWNHLSVKFKKNVHPESKKSAVINLHYDYKDIDNKRKLECVLLWCKSQDKISFTGLNESD